MMKVGTLVDSNEEAAAAKTSVPIEIAPETRELVLHFARANPRWGYQRISGELAKVAIAVSPNTVRRVLARAGLKPAPRRDGPTWREFLHAQASGIIGVERRDRLGGLLHEHHRAAE